MSPSTTTTDASQQLIVPPEPEVPYQAIFDELIQARTLAIKSMNGWFCNSSKQVEILDMAVKRRILDAVVRNQSFISPYPTIKMRNNSAHRILRVRRISRFLLLTTIFNVEIYDETIKVIGIIQFKEERFFRKSCTISDHNKKILYKIDCNLVNKKIVTNEHGAIVAQLDMDRGALNFTYGRRVNQLTYGNSLDVRSKVLILVACMCIEEMAFA